MSSDAAISIRGLSKSYTIAHDANRASTLGEALSNLLRKPFTRATTETFWALKDVDFDVERGEVVGVIGRNGAGKSTLLKILSRITEPTEGRVDLNGRVGSLLEVGTGFHPELTGRENVFLNGAILGMRKAEIGRQFDAIVDFAEIEKFLDTPVKRYSSGMYVRLAFAVAAHLDPEVLIIDEVLAVGDAAFQAKCLGKIRDVARSGTRTVLFVSHNMNAVSSLCSRAAYFEKGRLAFLGSVREGLELYTGRISTSHTIDLSVRTQANAGRPLVFRRLEVLDGTGRPTATVEAPSELRLRFGIASASRITAPRIGVGFNDWQGERIFAVGSFIGEGNLPSIDGHCVVEARFALPALLPGRYTLDISVSDGPDVFLDEVHMAAALDVMDSNYLRTSQPYFAQIGHVLVRSAWSASS